MVDDLVAHALDEAIGYKTREFTSRDFDYDPGFVAARNTIIHLILEWIHTSEIF